MKRVLLFLLIASLPCLTMAKGDVLDSMNTEAFWKNMAYTDYKDASDAGNMPRIPDAETMIVVASNRMPKWGKPRFMGEERGTEHLTYFLAFVKDGKWHLWRMSLKSAIASVRYPDRDWVIYTEGYGKIFTNGIYRGLSVADQHKVNVLYLDYPSYTTAKKVLGNYYFAQDNAKLAGDDFAPVLDTVRRLREAGRMGTGHLSLFYHSMGNNAIREMVRTNRIRTMNSSVWVDNLILNSACVPEGDHKAWVDRIRFARHIYVNYNPKDRTLGGAALVSLTRQMGQGPRVNASNKAVYVNFNKLCMGNHSNFVMLEKHSRTTPAALAYYNIIFHGHAAPVENPDLFANSSFHNIGYDLICTDAAVMRVKPAGGEEETAREAADEAIIHPAGEDVRPTSSTNNTLRRDELQHGASMLTH